MESKKRWNLDQYKNEAKETPKGVVHENNKAESSQKKMKLAANTLIKNEDGNEMTVREWSESLEDGESMLVHCPISPESHSNGDATPSCSMQRNDDYLNLKCFGCGATAFYTTKKEARRKKSDDVEYTVPAFNKEEALKSVKENLENLDEILVVMIKYLPQLEKKEKDNS